MNALKAKYFEIYNRFVAEGFYKAESFIANAVAVLIGIVPDLINMLLSNWSMVDAIPTLSPEHKLRLFATANVIALILRARKQANMQPKPPDAEPAKKEGEAGATG